MATDSKIIIVSPKQIEITIKDEWSVNNKLQGQIVKVAKYLGVQPFGSLNLLPNDLTFDTFQTVQLTFFQNADAFKSEELKIKYGKVMALMELEIKDILCYKFGIIKPD